MFTRGWDWRRWRTLLPIAAVLLISVGLAVPSSATEDGKTQLPTGTSMYPRLIRLADGSLLTSVLGFDSGTQTSLLRSTDEGATFHQVGTIVDGNSSAGECCGTLFQLPRPVDGLPAGTVLWAGSFGQNGGAQRRMSIRVWASRDDGAHWSYLSTCARNDTAAALWEPELSQAADGRLACYFGDESQNPTHSQVVAMTTSADGVHWSAKSTVIATARTAERPGMANVRRLPDGRYLMTYENCNVPHYFCGGYIRFSADGVHWGDPGDYGTKVSTADGHYFQHAQT
ncbi:MAG: exo-alpha-sialidase, partial [Sciscionella sp.]|nr:exo-alpha-sialidase [Sciscionella sp.]